MICTESLSSKSNDNSKVSPTGSAGSDKYHALEDEYIIAYSGKGNTWIFYTIFIGSKRFNGISCKKEKHYLKIMVFEQSYEH